MFTVNNYIDRKLDKLNHFSDHHKKANEFIQLGSYEGQRDFIVAASREVATEDLSPLQKEYRAFFTTLLENYGVSSPSELTDDQKVEVFNTVSKNWVAGKGPRKGFDVNKWEPDSETAAPKPVGKKSIKGRSKSGRPGKPENMDSNDYADQDPDSSINDADYRLILEDKELKDVHKEARSLLNRADKLTHKVNFEGTVSIKDIDESVDIILRRDFDSVCQMVAGMSGKVDKNIDKVYNFFDEVCNYLEAVIDVCNDLSTANKELKSASGRVNKNLNKLSTGGFH